MIKVKQKCDKWKAVFERQAKEDDELFSVPKGTPRHSMMRLEDSNFQL